MVSTAVIVNVFYALMATHLQLTSAHPCGGKPHGPWGPPAANDAVSVDLDTSVGDTHEVADRILLYSTSGPPSPPARAFLPRLLRKLSSG